MTGTLSGNNDIEPWCILHNLNVAGQGKINPHAFKNSCCVLELQYGPFGNFLKPTKLNDKGLEMLEKAYKEGVMFWAYDESDEMPPMVIDTITFKVEATREYKNALEGILKLGEHESTVMKAIALQKAQQALNGFLYFDNDGYRATYDVLKYVNPKLQYVVDESRKELTIIGYRFQEDGASIEAALDQNEVTHTTKMSEFKTGQYQVLVLQCSRGKSANLQLCQNILYYSSDFSFISYKQFIHRTWRRGQDSPCRVRFLINDPGDKYKIEWKIWNSLHTKQNIHDTLMAIKQSL
jgi:hypothetical protein